MALDNTTATAGHNNPPPYDVAALAEFDNKISDFNSAAKEWLDLGDIETEEQAEKLGDFITGTSKLIKKVDNQRSADKKPHLDAGREIDAEYNSRKSKLSALLVGSGKIPGVKAILDRFLTKKQAELEAKQRAEQEEAERKAEAARLAALEAEQTNDLVAQDEAAKAQEEAEKAKAEAEKPTKARVGSASGGGRTISRRKVKTASILNINVAFMQFSDAPEVAEVLVMLANRKIRAVDWDGVDPKGFEVTEKEVL